MQPSTIHWSRAGFLQISKQTQHSTSTLRGFSEHSHDIVKLYSDNSTIYSDWFDDLDSSSLGCLETDKEIFQDTRELTPKSRKPRGRRQTPYWNKMLTSKPALYQLYQYNGYDTPT